jgi:hypothetical protein
MSIPCPKIHGVTRVFFKENNFGIRPKTRVLWAILGKERKETWILPTFLSLVVFNMGNHKLDLKDHI